MEVGEGGSSGVMSDRLDVREITVRWPVHLFGVIWAGWRGWFLGVSLSEKRPLFSRTGDRPSWTGAIGS